VELGSHSTRAAAGTRASLNPTQLTRTTSSQSAELISARRQSSMEMKRLRLCHFNSQAAWHHLMTFPHMDNEARTRNTCDCATEAAELLDTSWHGVSERGISRERELEIPSCDQSNGMGNGKQERLTKRASSMWRQRLCQQLSPFCKRRLDKNTPCFDARKGRKPPKQKSHDLLCRQGVTMLVCYKTQFVV
jgi:hypothetical protein